MGRRRMVATVAGLALGLAALVGLGSAAQAAEEPAGLTVEPTTGLVDQQGVRITGYPAPAVVRASQCPAGVTDTASCIFLGYWFNTEGQTGFNVQARVWDAAAGAAVDCRSGAGRCEMVIWIDDVPHRVPLEFTPDGPLKPVIAGMTPQGVLADGAEVSVHVSQTPLVSIGPGLRWPWERLAVVQCATGDDSTCRDAEARFHGSWFHKVAARFTTADGRVVDCTRAAGACSLRVSNGPPIWWAYVPLEFAAPASEPTAAQPPSAAAPVPEVAASEKPARPFETAAELRRGRALGAAGRAEADGDGGSPWWPWLVGGLIVVALAAGGGWWYRRRHREGPPDPGAPDEPTAAPPTPPRVPTPV